MLLLVAVLGFAVVQPWGYSEAAVAVPAACLVVVLGVLPWQAAVAELWALAVTVGVLAGVMALGYLCEVE